MKDNDKRFEDMLREQRGTIEAVCYLFAKDNDEREDFFQEALINLWNGFDKFQGKSSIKTWVYRVTLNTCISYERKRKHHKISALNRDIAAEEIMDERSEELRRRISCLNVLDRAIVLLWLEQLPYDEIAAIVGITTKNVSVRLTRIREQLKKIK